MTFLKIYKERRDIPEISVLPEIRSHQIKEKYFILFYLVNIWLLSNLPPIVWLLKHVQLPPLIQSFSVTRNHASSTVTQTLKCQHAHNSHAKNSWTAKCVWCANSLHFKETKWFWVYTLNRIIQHFTNCYNSIKCIKSVTEDECLQCH
jgi:hypothetical protein